MSRELGSAFDLPEDERSAADASAELFGVKEVFGKTRPNRVKPLALANVIPDPYQPRRAMPLVVRRLWDGTSPTLPHVIEMWVQLAEEERGAPLDVDAWIRSDKALDGDADGDGVENDILSTIAAPTPKQGPIEFSLTSVLDLATSIYRDGLTNPITVFLKEDDSGYLIETGERRWIAYHILNILFPDDGYDRIPARIMEEFSVWRQATENSARANLNAIERARQFALLMMDLWRTNEKQTKDFAPINSFEHEQDFYSQVSDESPPYGTGSMLLNAMGVTHKSAITRYRALLRLPTEIWDIADDLDWNLSDLYKMTTIDEESAFKMACAMAKRDGQKVAWCNLPDEPDERPVSAQPMDVFRERQLPALEKTLRKLAGSERRQAILYLRELLEKLDE